MTGGAVVSRTVEVGPAIRSVLHVSAAVGDVVSLRTLLPANEWRVEHSPTVTAAIARLRRLPYDLVLCEQHVADGTWLDIRDILFLLPNPPALVVASPFADERFWAEALNIGAYDVLAKPFDATEVNRVLNAACRFRDREARGSLKQALSAAAAYR